MIIAQPSPVPGPRIILFPVGFGIPSFRTMQSGLSWTSTDDAPYPFASKSFRRKQCSKPNVAFSSSTSMKRLVKNLV